MVVTFHPMIEQEAGQLHRLVQPVGSDAAPARVRARYDLTQIAQLFAQVGNVVFVQFDFFLKWLDAV